MRTKPHYRLTAAARLDLMQISNYLAETASPRIADHVLTDIESAIEFIAQTPGCGHHRPDLTKRDLRFHLVHSYLVIYRGALA